MKCYISILLVLLCLTACSEKEKAEIEINIIPKPLSIQTEKGSFEISSETTFSAPSEFEIATNFLRSYLAKGAGISLDNSSTSDADIRFKINNTLAKEAYLLGVFEEGIEIQSSDAAGAFYAVQTLRQLLPTALEGGKLAYKQSIVVPYLNIADEPKFKYRGMHLDVARHFFPKEFIKEYISYLALLKMNRFHWHLTDDQGWRIEIKQYPRLTEHAAYREETLLGHYNDQPQQFDGKNYGGFYTQEEVKEIVAYAQKLNVTIIPEIEMPGHAQAAISAYPELGCTGQPVDVATKWGVFENVFCPNEKTFEFLQNTLTEVIDLFPGEYIHIGGDEAPKAHWESCDHCQKLIKEKGLKNEHGLQSYFIKEIERFVNSKGKKIIGWDEILEGGLAPNATVMSWRGTEGAVKAAQQGNDVIMTPTSHAYFDYYQDDHPNEPIAIGGFLPLKKVYSFNPIPEELVDKETRHVLGAQGNIWTEYIKTPSQVQYMAFPRMLAMAEVVWSGPTENLEADFPEFLSRVEPFMSRLDALDVNYANHLYDLEGSITRTTKSVFYEITTPTSDKVIKYSVNGGRQEQYTKPIEIIEDTELTAQVYKDGKPVGRIFTETILFHKAVNAGIGLNRSPHPAYNTGGISALNNGILGSDARYGDKEWLGFWGDDIEVTIDFATSVNLRHLKTRFYNAPGQWIYAPKSTSLYIRYEDGSQSVVSTRSEFDVSSTLVLLSVNFPDDPRKINSIQLKVPSYGTIAEGLQGAGNKAWTFIDEIIVE